MVDDASVLLRSAMTMTLRHRHARSRRIAFTAWTGLFAIWLTVFAPVVTQLLAQQVQPLALFVPFAPLCSALSSASGNVAASSAGDRSSPPMPHDKTCGYCNLFAHHPLAAGASPSVGVASFIACAHIARNAAPLRALAQFNAARPRGPPMSLS